MGEEMKRPTFGVNRSKREVTEGQHRPNLWAWYLEHLLTDFAAKMEDPFLLQIGTNGPRARGWNGQLSGSGGQRSTSHDAEVRFGGIILDPSSSRFSGFSFYHAVLLQSSVSSVLWQFCLSIYHTEAVRQSYGNSVCPFITPRQCVRQVSNVHQSLFKQHSSFSPRKLEFHIWYKTTRMVWLLRSV